jgi:hypothetical protein
MPSADVLRTAEILKEFQSGPKQYRRTEDSLAHFYLRPDTKWGFVIVRAVYGPSSDARWAQMLEIFRANVEDTLTMYDQTELLQRHETTIIEDEATLDGADSYTARRAFRAWVAADLPQRLRDDCLEEWGGHTQVRDKLLSNDPHTAPNTIHPASLVPPRWQYCIFVDEDCLRSLDKGPEDPELKDPVLKILTTDWELEEVEVPTEEFTRDWEGGETDDGAEEVGWMYMDMSDYVATYDRLTSSAFSWHELYERPYKSYVEDSDC